MSKRWEILPGVYFRGIQSHQFKTACVSIHFLRQLSTQENALNALIGNVLLRGTEELTDLRKITQALDGLYGAEAGPMILKTGQIQTVGLGASFMEDRFALPGDQVTQPVLELLAQVLLRPRLENGVFCAEFVESEKHNLISLIESQINDKRVYAANRMLKLLCGHDPFGIPRLGTVEQVEAVTPEALYAHYRRVLARSQAEIFYCGAMAPEEMAALLRDSLKDLPRETMEPAVQGPFIPQSGTRYEEETMDVSQGKLCLGFTTPITNQSGEFAAMMVFNALYGAGYTSKLFMNVREKLSLCYYASSAYYGTKGIFTVDSGIETGNFEVAKAEILRQLEACQAGDFTDQELSSAKAAICNGLKTAADSAGRLDSYYTAQVLSGKTLEPADYMAQIEAVTAEQVAKAAQTLRLDTVFFLKGVAQ